MNPSTSIQRRTSSHRSKPFRLVVAIVAMAYTAIVPDVLAATDESSWQVVGHQGVLQVVIVPKEQASNDAAYQAEIAKLCAPQTTCFINFFTNTTGVQAELPLPDVIAHEATARFRRSMKNGVEKLEWSCRLNRGNGECF